MIATTAHTRGIRNAFRTNQRITASIPTCSPETENKCMVPVKRKSSVKPSGALSVTPSVIPLIAPKTSGAPPRSVSKIDSIRWRAAMAAAISGFPFPSDTMEPGSAGSILNCVYMPCLCSHVL